jgi:putative chitinase
MLTQLEVWRIQAFKRLRELIANLQGEINANDEAIDHLIRVLSNLPTRPVDRPAYTGIFAITNLIDGRKRASEQLQSLASQIKGEITMIDGLVDDLIRMLSNLPSRPIDKSPYESLFPKTAIQFLTVEQLLSIAQNATRDRVALLTPYLNRAMVEFNITTLLRQAHFIAQVAHESDEFNALEEYASGEDYEGREDLGNTQPSDGVRFKGRGLIQITGRSNYKRCGDALGIDLIRNPIRLAEPELACRSAGWFWDSNQLNGDADGDDVRTVTRIINGGFNGLEHRIQLLDAAKQALRVPSGLVVR